MITLVSGKRSQTAYCQGTYHSKIWGRGGGYGPWGREKKSSITRMGVQATKSTGIQEALFECGGPEKIN